MTKIKIYCTNLNREVEVAGGETLAELAARIAPELGFSPVVARVNNRTEGLTYELFKPKEVEFLDRTTPTGSRVYIRSLSMVLYCAVAHLWPGTRLKIGQHLSKGYFCTLHGIDADESHIAALKAEMQRLISLDLPFERFERRTPEVIEVFRKEGLEDKVRLLSSYRQPYKTYYRLDGVCDSFYGPLMLRTGLIDSFELIPYKSGFILEGFERTNPDLPQQKVTSEKMYAAFTNYLAFNKILGISDVGELNETVARGGSETLINVAEALHDQAIGKICDDIAERYSRGGARVVLVAGPSSSGKTTTCKRIAIQLLTRLLKPHMISLDDYFVDREHTPRDADGDYDFESLYALDIEHFNHQLCQILAGEEVNLPSFSFELGRRVPASKPLKLEPGGILLIEGIHGLNPELTAQIPEHDKYRVYVSALTTLAIDDHNWIPTSDNRLLRRIIRDYKYRGTSAAESIRRWPSVRRGEEKWIFPYQDNADATFNSSLLFELAVMKNHASDVLAEVPRDCKEYAEAYRLRKFLSYFTAIQPTAVPPTSLLREFLGGSSFHY